MKTTTVDAATADLSQLLDAVEKGETLTITRRGIAVATLSPAISQERSEEIEALMRQWQEARKGVTLGGVSIRELIEEGRA